MRKSSKRQRRLSVLRGQNLPAVSAPPPSLWDDDDERISVESRATEVKTLQDLTKQSSTPIPAMFQQFFKFIGNPSTVSVETYKRMVDTDDTIGSGVDFLTTCLSARLGRYTHPSKEITEWMNKVLDHVENGFQACMKELLGATWAGFAVQEKVWANTELGFTIQKLASLPPTSILFEADRCGEITPDGILQYQRNFAGAGSIGGGYGFSLGAGVGAYGAPFANDPGARYGDFLYPTRTGANFDYMALRIPRAKCIHYAFDAQGKFGNPYGRSMLRRAYKWYVMKDGFLQMLAIALDRKGTPLTIVFADPNAVVGAGPGAAGQMGATKDGKNIGMRADVAAAKAFANVHNDSVIVLPGKKGQIYDTEFVQSTSNAGDFMAAIDLCNKSILRALLVPSLIFGNGDGTGSYSLGQEHAKTFDKILDGMLGAFKQCLLQQMVKDLLAYNFPASAWEKDGLGDFSKQQMTPDEISKEVDILEKAVNIGAVDMNDLNDLNQIRDKIGFEARDQPIKRPTPLDPFGGGEEGEEGAVDEDGNPVKPKAEAGAGKALPNQGKEFPGV